MVPSLGKIEDRFFDVKFLKFSESLQAQSFIYLQLPFFFTFYINGQRTPRRNLICQKPSTCTNSSSSVFNPRAAEAKSNNQSSPVKRLADSSFVVLFSSLALPNPAVVVQQVPQDPSDSYLLELPESRAKSPSYRRSDCFSFHFISFWRLAHFSALIYRLVWRIGSR